MGRPKEINSLNTIGYSTIAVDKATKAKIKSLARDKQIFEFVRELVDNYVESEPQAPLGLGSPGKPRDMAEVNAKLESLSNKVSLALAFLMAQVPEEERRELSDREILESMGRALRSAGIKAGSWFNSHFREQASFNFGEESS